MNYVANILIALVIATTAACVEAPAEPGTAESVVLLRAYHGATDVNAPDRRAEFKDVDGWDELSDHNGEAELGMCGCDSDECETAWVQENYGCGICITVRCGDGGSASQCVACGPQQGSRTLETSKVQLHGVK